MWSDSTFKPQHGGKASEKHHGKGSSHLPTLDKPRSKRYSSTDSIGSPPRGSKETSPAVAAPPAPIPMPVPVQSSWARAAANNKVSMQEIIKESRREWKEQAHQAYRDAMRQAHKAWKTGELQDCDRHLSNALSASPSSDMLHRFRATVRSRNGKLNDALADAGNAVANSPGNPRNHHAFAVANHRNNDFSAAGTAYLTSMNRGLTGSSDELGFTGFLNSVRRHRNYYGDVRPAHRKAVHQLFLARTPSRASIFDPEKTLDEEGVAQEDLELPEPPQLRLVSAEENSINVEWIPSLGGDGAAITIYAYELEMAQYDVVWEGERFFDGYRPFEKIHKGSSSITSTSINGLRTDNKVLLRIRAQSYSGLGDWNELVVSTLPPPSRRADALPLPRKWLQVDVADLVPLHVMEVGGDPKRFFLELASCFTPHVRAIKRLFNGWSRAGQVGQKVRSGELSRQQFHRFAKEVGIAQGGGPMTKRSGAKLMSTNEVDRLFQRANMDSRESANTRGGLSKDAIAANLKLDHTEVAKLAESALDDLVADENAGIEKDAGESELRDKLKPLFEQFDEDGSGAVSTDEVGKMAKSLGIEMNAKQLADLMIEADPDGSGEVDFEELLAVLKKQMKEGSGGAMAALFKVEVDDGDGGVASMVLIEFIHALIRLAWDCFPDPSTGIGTRLNKLLERAVLPGSAHFLESNDPMEAELRSKRVQAITEYFSNDLNECFQVFAASDQSLSGQTTQDSMSFAELIFMLKAGGMIDSNLTVAQITAMFALINAQGADDGEKDDDAQELNFGEFKALICRIANAKIPASARGGEPFEFTWQAFLQIVFLPKYRSVIKDMKRGLAKKTL